MARGIYLLDKDNRLVEMLEQDYESEDLLQELLAEHPDLLAGGQIDEESPRRWLLVSREAGLPSSDEGGSRWSVDHLFLDQDGIPTLVEVKRSTDSRIRREVVGQMLDYAANAVAYWPVESVQALIQARATSAGTDPELLVDEFLGPGGSVDEFWRQVKTNLQAGRIRLVFISDAIPSELLRIIEFLNKQMDPAEVIGVEVKQFAGEGVRSLVPRVLGQTEEARQKKSAGARESRKWDETSLFQTLEARGDSEQALAARKLLEWARERGLRIWWGEGVKQGSFYPMLDREDGSQYTIGVKTGYTTPFIEIPFADYLPPFNSTSKKSELLAKLDAIAGVNISPDRIDRFPSLKLSAVTSEEELGEFLAVLDWLVDESEAQ